MTGISPVRWVLGVVGFLVGLYGLDLLLSNQQGEQLTSVGIWLLGAVVVHDAVLAVVAVAVGFLVTRFVPRLVRTPLVVGLVVLGTISIVAIPFVGAFGRIPDNPTLLDRDYVAGYALIVVLVVVGVVAGSVWRARIAPRGQDGSDPVPDDSETAGPERPGGSSTTTGG